MKILGINIGQDRSSSLIIDNQIIADVSEERFTRIKHYAGLPVNSINFCLDAGKISFDELDFIAISGEITDPKLKTLLKLSDEKFNQIITNNLPQISFRKREKSIKKNKKTNHEPPPLYMSF